MAIYELNPQTELLLPRRWRWWKDIHTFYKWILIQRKYGFYLHPSTRWYRWNHIFLEDGQFMHLRIRESERNKICFEDAHLLHLQQINKVENIEANRGTKQ